MEAACEGAGSVTGAGDGREGRITGEKSEDERVYPGVSVKDRTVLFIVGILMVIIVETIKQYKKMWNEISQMFLIGSLSGIAVLGNTIREHLSVNLILLFMFINMGVILLRVYLKKKFEYM